jgi:hypothetical protein
MNRTAPKITLDKFKQICDNKFDISKGGFDPYEMLLEDSRNTT